MKFILFVIITLSFSGKNIYSIEVDDLQLPQQIVDQYKILLAIKTPANYHNYSQKWRKLYTEAPDDKKNSILRLILESMEKKLNKKQIRGAQLALEALRETHPQVKLYVDEFRDAFFVKNRKKADPCAYLCQMRKDALKWLRDIDYNSLQSNYNVPNSSQKTAYSTLGILFLLKTRSYCGSRRIIYHGEDPIILQAREAFIEGKLPEDAISCKIGHLGPQDLGSMMAVINGLREKAPKINNQYDLYAMVYTIKIYKELLKLTFNKDEQEKIRKKIRDLNAALNNSLNLYKTKLHGNFGSLFNNYALSVAAESFDMYSNAAVAFMRDLHEKLRKTNVPGAQAHLVPLAIPYNANFHPGSANLRSAAGRSVPFYFALWEKERKILASLNLETKMKKKLEQKEFEYRKRLIFAIENYRKHLPSLVSFLDSSGAHHGKDALAPYYFYATFPYVTASINELIKHGNLSDDTLKTMQSIKDDFLRVVTTVKASAKAKPKDDGWWGKGSQAYVNPLLGLALIPLCPHSNGQGILD